MLREMLRWIRVMVVVGCLAAQMSAQAAKEAGAAELPPAAKPAETTPTAKPASAQNPLDSFTDFSAILVGSPMEIGEGTTEAHVYRSGKLFRAEGPEGHGYLITDLSTLETWAVSSGPCMHDTHPFFRASPWAASRPGSTVERNSVAKETIDGHSCQVEDVVIHSPKPAMAPLKMKMWLADDLQGFPIRIDIQRAPGRSATIRYKNVAIGPQDQSLFVHPKSCENLPNKEDMVKSTPKSGANATAPKTTAPKANAPAKKPPADTPQN